MPRKKKTATREGGGKDNGPILAVEFSLPQAREAIATFADNRIAALDWLSRSVRDGMGRYLNQLLNAEMALFLGTGEQKKNRRNGFTTRLYGLKGVGTVRLRVPRDRNGEFTSRVIPPSERFDPRVRQDLALLHLAGISSRNLATIANRVLGMNVSRETVLESLVPLREAAQGWLTRPIEGPYWALYIDAINISTRRRDSVELEPYLTVVGVDATNHRSILAVEPGTREDVAAWRAALTELKRRGLKPSEVRIGIMDGLPGLEEAFRQEFPGATTARCWLHALRNAVPKAPSRLRTAFKELAERVMYASSEDAARKAFGKLKEAMGEDGQRAVACLDKDIDALVVHYRFDKRLWLALKTTNPVERVHREIRRRTKSMDAIGEGNLTVLIAFTALRLEAGWKRQKVDSRSMQNLEAKHRRATESEDATDEAMKVLIGPPAPESTSDPGK